MQLWTTGVWLVREIIRFSLNAGLLSNCVPNFQKEVLAVPEPANSPLERMTREARADMDSGTPIEFVRQKLINLRLARELVDQTIEQTAGPARRTCPNDTLTYRATVARCAQCDASLNAA